MKEGGLPQEYNADLLFGDWGYFCTPALSEVLQIPRVTVSNIPIVDPIHTTWDHSTGRRMNVPNMLAYTPQASGDPAVLAAIPEAQPEILIALNYLHTCAPVEHLSTWHPFQ